MILLPLIVALAVIFFACVLTFVWNWWFVNWNFRDIHPMVWVLLGLGVAAFLSMLALFMITNWSPFEIIA